MKVYIVEWSDGDTHFNESVWGSREDAEKRLDYIRDHYDDCSDYDIKEYVVGKY